ncbi:MAG: glutamyl-tRNA reductase [Legionellales bacterium]|jgi:glutamyl-tRNA reductase|nr:glutamyl-tRNA reductase [Legionellales bacterium]
MISIFGFSHHRCSVDFRERVSLPQDQFCSVLRKVQQLTQCEDVLFFSTCNRTELVIGSNNDIPKKVLLNWLSAHCNIEMSILEKHHYLYTKEKAIHHLLRVCSGLDSKLVGETQVFGQFKTAYSIAKDAGTLDGSMDWILQEVFSIAKAIRHTTKISHNSESMGYAIKKIVQSNNQTIQSSNLLFIGTGEIISVAIDYLGKELPNSITIASRSLQRAIEFAKPHHGKGIRIQDVPNAIKHADIVISASASQLPIIGKGMIETILKDRNGLTLFDLAMPRDIEPEIASLKGITLYNIDQVQSFISHTEMQRETRVKAAEKAISDAIPHLMKELTIKDQQGIIVSLREKMHDLKNIQLKKAQQQLTQGQNPTDVLNENLNQLTNRLLHLPTALLRSALLNEDVHTLKHLKDLFSLED